MKMYSCPDCGKVFDENSLPSSCPNCGCPSSEFKEISVGAGHVSTTMSEEKVYFADSRVRITNKLWRFGEGLNTTNNKLAVIVYYPVSAISSVSVSRPLDWLLFVIAGILLLILSFVPFNILGNDAARWILFVVLCLPAILFFYWANRRLNLRKLMIRPHNSLVLYSFEVQNEEEAQKYLKPMLQCLKEN